MTPHERIEPADGHFYLTGLGLLMQDVPFTPDEQLLLSYLCHYAARGDEAYLQAIRGIRADAAASHLLEHLKNTLRTMGKGPALQAYYDRAA